MQTLKPLIKIFRISENEGYFFDANKNEIVEVSPRIYRILENILQGDISENIKKVGDTEFLRFYKQMTEKGYLSGNRVKVIEHPMSDYIEETLENNIESINLQVTQNCNLRCSYCPYTGNYYQNRQHNQKKMDFEMAKKGIDFLAEHSSGTDMVNVAFYGGEPFLEFKLIEKCMEYSKEVFNGKRVVFTITTNATILNDEIMKALVDNDVSLTVSLDGPEDIHNLGRVFPNGNGSFKLVFDNLKLFKMKYPEYFCKNVMFNTVIARGNDLECIEDFFEQEELFSDNYVTTTFYSNTYVKKEELFSVSKQFCIYHEYGKYKYFLYKLGRVQNAGKSRVHSTAFATLRETNKMLNESQKLPPKFHPSGPCIPGRKKLFLNVFGNFYPCERINELSDVSVIGNIYDGLDISKCNKLLNIGKITEKQCKECWAIGHCKLCFVQADDGERLSAESRLNNCKDIKDMIVEQFRDICFLKKYKCNFEDEIRRM